jgi:hypothetical protein
MTTHNWNSLQGENRPKCSVPECNRDAASVTTKKDNKIWRRASWIKEKYPDVPTMWCCLYHHNKNIAQKHGVKSSNHLTARRAGLTITKFRNKRHRYLKYRKDYCENIDGRLGFVCNTVLPTQEMLNAAGLIEWEPIQFLEVDHIDGNHTHNDPRNLQTLCKHCHTIKSYKYGDYKTPGRKTRCHNK